MTSSGMERNYMCQRCLNHNKHVLRKGHVCEFKICDCQKCILNDERKNINRQITKNKKLQSGKPSSDKEKDSSQHCTLCQNHDLTAKLKGHKKDCPFKDCTCQSCSYSKKHRQIMAQQTKNRRKQKTGPKSLPRKGVQQQEVAVQANQDPIRPSPVRAVLPNEFPKVPSHSGTCASLPCHCNCLPPNLVGPPMSMMFNHHLPSFANVCMVPQWPQRLNHDGPSPWWRQVPFNTSHPAALLFRSTMPADYALSYPLWV